ncbi:unnamed protein product [Ixodes persulcatus]
MCMYICACALPYSLLSTAKDPSPSHQLPKLRWHRTEVSRKSVCSTYQCSERSVTNRCRFAMGLGQVVAARRVPAAACFFGREKFRTLGRECRGMDDRNTLFSEGPLVPGCHTPQLPRHRPVD